ncbi:hypothetical protein FRB96_008902 [Tulasnella sp. 330]|nr:hypothetical protein FRB96_008902 [Tulasnella sp. 330]
MPLFEYSMKGQNVIEPGPESPALVDGLYPIPSPGRGEYASERSNSPVLVSHPTPRLFYSPGQSIGVKTPLGPSRSPELHGEPEIPRAYSPGSIGSDRTWGPPPAQSGQLSPEPPSSLSRPGRGSLFDRVPIQVGVPVPKPTPLPTWAPHAKWGHVTVTSLIVEDTLYRVPQGILMQSTYFSDTLSGSDFGRFYPRSQLKLDDVTEFEMDSLLTVINAPAIGNTLSTLDSDQWAAVLRLSTKWGFAAVREHAINVFDTRFHDQETFARIDLARRCEVAKWFPPAYRQLCERHESLDLVEAEKLGLPQFVAICRIRDALGRARLEDVVRSVDGRLGEEEVSLNGRCTGCRMKVAVSGKPYEGMGFCREEMEKSLVNGTTHVADMVADAEELQVVF